MAVPAKVIYGKINVVKLTKAIGTFNKTYHERMKILMRGAVKAFVKTTVELVGVETGMSGATLQPLAKAVGTGVLGEIRARGPISELPWGTTMTGRSYRSKKKSINEGIKAGMSAYKLNYGTVKRPMMFLRFETNVYQYAFWESKLWFSLAAGTIAMVEYIEENFTKYFPIEDFNQIIDYNQIWDFK